VSFLRVINHVLIGFYSVYTLNNKRQHPDVLLLVLLGHLLFCQSLQPLHHIGEVLKGRAGQALFLAPAEKLIAGKGRHKAALVAHLGPLTLKA